MDQTINLVLNDNNNECKNKINEEDKELLKLLEMKEKINMAQKEALEAEYDKHIEGCKNNLNIFVTWFKSNSYNNNLYNDFTKNFSTNYRIELFENINEFFMEENLITDDVIYYWKNLVIALLYNSKKYKSYLKNLEFDEKNKSVNLRLVPKKLIFECFIGDEHLCYFKENGFDYYVS